MTPGVRPPVLGAVLAGGASSRFGSDKAAALWEGKALADHAATVVRPLVDDVVLVGPRGLADLPQPGMGPLGGIAAALDLGRRRGVGSVLTIACDMPRVRGDLIEALLRRSPSYCADAPVLGHWPTALADELINMLSNIGRSSSERRGIRKSGALSLRRWAEEIGALPVAAPEPLPNINTPADLMAL